MSYSTSKHHKFKVWTCKPTEGTFCNQMAELVSINALRKEQIKTMQMIKQDVIHLREPGLGKHYTFVKEYSLVGVVTPPYLIKRTNLPNIAQKLIRIKLCLLVLICFYQHKSRCMGKIKMKLSQRHRNK